MAGAPSRGDKKERWHISPTRAIEMRAATEGHTTRTPGTSHTEEHRTAKNTHTHRQPKARSSATAKQSKKGRNGKHSNAPPTPPHDRGQCDAANAGGGNKQGHNAARTTATPKATHRNQGSPQKTKEPPREKGWRKHKPTATTRKTPWAKGGKKKTDTHHQTNMQRARSTRFALAKGPAGPHKQDTQKSENRERHAESHSGPSKQHTRKRGPHATKRLQDTQKDTAPRPAARLGQNHSEKGRAHKAEPHATDACVYKHAPQNKTTEHKPPTRKKKCKASKERHIAGHLRKHKTNAQKKKETKRKES
ncbi:hypothetical protein, conserved in T. vivax [Trypanosoma vivax Y486]|uniref:Uncharacterized protein n=1 Tax=Trypanosoma vivax (strain Y486) TaxID=1055687 RepID=F9WSS6_TRYVY|nr:hypothetical protein, conserved in T. vivax [Trypanosoma vivax Y486]|eukprot:CCD20615.1 hypothetical protein, conserved in T. vivax [Trypanosoma vivax Y486]